METKAKVIERMDEVREDLDWNMERIASYLEVEGSTYQRWRHGETEPNFENTLKIQNFIEDYENGDIDRKQGRKRVPTREDLESMEKTEEGNNYEVYES